EAKKLGAKLKDASVTIRAKTSEAESLYGSVNAAQILAALKEQGFASLEESMLQLEAPIKALGTYDVPVKVHPDVTETVKVWVVAE
ncbi:50S ribosomal protein L9, partial [Citrobacter sp. AAK_AS5]